MKHLRILIIALMAFALNASAQGDGRDRPRFSPQEFMKKQEAFIIREAGLSPSEAAAFFPLYHKMGKERFDIGGKIRACMKRIRTADLSDKEATAALKEIDELQLEKVKLENSYHQKFRKVLSTQKVLRVIDADSKFERHILGEMMRRHNDGRGRRNRR